MKRISTVVLFFLLAILTMQGCNQTANIDKNGDNSSGEFTTHESLFLIEDSADNLISIQVPVDQRVSDAQQELFYEYILNQIKNNFDESFVLSESENEITDKSRLYTHCYIVAQSRVEYYSETVVSIVVEGLYNKRGTAHPIHFLWTLNYNPETLETVSFSQQYKVDADLYRVFSQTAQSDIIALCDGKWPAGWGDFEEAICSEDRFLEGLSANGNFYYYFTENGVVVSIPVAYVMGNYMEVFLPYNTLTAVGQTNY